MSAASSAANMETGSSSGASTATSSSSSSAIAASTGTNAIQPLSKSALKQLEKQRAAEAKKLAHREKQAKEEQARKEREIRLRAAVQLVEDTTLPPAKLITIDQVSQHISQRVKIQGWVHSFQSRGRLLFIRLRDGSGISPTHLNAVLEPPTSQSYEAKTLEREACVRLYGTLQRAENALGDTELAVDYWEQISASDRGIESTFILAPDVPSYHVTENRHLYIRKVDQVEIIKMRSALCQYIRSYLTVGVTSAESHHVSSTASSSSSSSLSAAALVTTPVASPSASPPSELQHPPKRGGDFTEVTCPTIISQPMQDSSPNFWSYLRILNYPHTIGNGADDEHKEEDESKEAPVEEQKAQQQSVAYMTREDDTQRYLETCLPALNRVFSQTTAFDRENRNARHLNELTHFCVEMNIPTGDLDELLNAIEDFFVEVVEKLMQSPYGDIILKHNPAFLPPRRPFLRTTQADAEVFYRENHLDSEFYFYNQYGQRKLAEHVGQPFFMLRSPVNRPWTYAKCHDAPHLLESVDLLLPGFGSILSCGGMRETSYDALMNGFASANINPTPFYWYTDLRKFGSTPHGGFSVCIEFMLMWLLNKDNVRKVVLYQRQEHCLKP